MPPKHRKPGGTGTSVEIGEEQLTNLQTQISFNSEDSHNHVVTLADGIGTVATDLDNTKADLSVVANDLTVVTANVETVDGKVNGLATDLQTVDDKVTAVEAKVDDINSKVNTIEVNMAKPIG